MTFIQLADFHALFDVDDNLDEEEDEFGGKEYEGTCHPLHHGSNYVIVVYFKRSSGKQSFCVL